MQHISIRKEHEIGTLLRTRDCRAYIVHPEGHAPRNTHQQMCHFLGKCTKILSFFVCTSWQRARASFKTYPFVLNIYIYIYDTKKIHLVLMQFARDATIRVYKCVSKSARIKRLYHIFDMRVLKDLRADLRAARMLVMSCLYRTKEQKERGLTANHIYE